MSKIGQLTKSMFKYERYLFRQLWSQSDIYNVYTPF